MLSLSSWSAGSILCAATFVSGLSAQAYATRVVASDTKGNAGGGIFRPGNALGAPKGGGGLQGSLDVHSLGTGGFLTLGFSVTITDGPGADFIVFENAFYGGGTMVYAEAMFVEVSSNGADFARFPNAYQGGVSGGNFTTNWPGNFRGLSGARPVFGGRPGIDNFDVVEAGGDAFDLADLSKHPLVIGKKVVLTAITQVRLVDSVSGVSRDSRNLPIYDASPGSADVEAISVIHHTGNVTGKGPRVALDVPVSGDFSLTLSDPDGWMDLAPASLKMALDGLDFPPLMLLQLMQVRAASSTSVTLQLGGPLPAGFFFQLSVSVKDKAGHRSGMTRVRPDGR